MTALILASASKARADLLRAAGYRFRQIPAGIAEPPPLPGVESETYLLDLATAKARTVAARFPRAFIIGADTALLFKGNVLGKAAGQEEAVAMLRQLAGRTHRITTAVCVLAPARRTSHSRTTVRGVVSAEVTLRPWNDARIRRYVRAVKPFDCAGAYAVQGGGGAIIERIDGDLSTVVGLPLGFVERALRRLGFGHGSIPGDFRFRL